MRLFYRFPPLETPLQMRSNDRSLVATVQGDAGGIALGYLYPSNLVSSYSLRRFVLHTPSEHTFQGRRVALELQLFLEGGRGATSTGSELAVVSIGFFATTTGNSDFLDALRQGGLPRSAGATTTVNRESPAVLDFQELFGPRGHMVSGSPSTFWGYEGSLTAPPCTTGVRWFVRDDALPAGVDAIAEFTEAIAAVAALADGYPGNDRQFQDVNGRNVTRFHAEDAIQTKGPPPRDEIFASAVAEAKAAAKAAAEAVGLRGYKKAPHSHRYAVATGEPALPFGVEAAEDHEVCVRNLKHIYDELAAGQERQRVECEGQSAAEKRILETTAADAERARANFLSQKALCNSETTVLELLQRQAQAQKAACDRISAKEAIVTDG